MVIHLAVHDAPVGLIRVDQPGVQVPRVDLVHLRLDLLRYLGEYLSLPFRVDLLRLLISRHLPAVHLLVGIRDEAAAVDAFHHAAEHRLEPFVRPVLLLDFSPVHLALVLLGHEVLPLVVLLPDHLAELVPRQGLAVGIDLAVRVRLRFLSSGSLRVRFVVVVVVVVIFVLVLGGLAADTAEPVAGLRGWRLGRGEHRRLVVGRIGHRDLRAADGAERGILVLGVVVVVVAPIECHRGPLDVVEASVERLVRWMGWGVGEG